MEKFITIAMLLVGHAVFGATPTLLPEGVTKRICSAFLAASNEAALVAGAMQKMELDADALNALARTTFGIAVADAGGHPYDEFDARRNFKLSDGEAKAFRHFFHSLLNGLLEPTNPVISQRVHPRVFIATHPQANHQRKFAELFAGEFREDPKVLLVHADFPALEPSLFDANPFVFYSSHGELPHVVAKKAVLGGGHLDDCLLTSARDFVLMSFRNPHLRHVDIEIRPSIVYSRTEDDSLRAEAARISTEELRVKVGEWLVDTIVEELNKVTRMQPGDEDEFELINWSTPKNVRDFLASSTLRHRATNKTATFTFSNR